MITPDALLRDLKRLLGRLEADLRERVDEVSALAESLRAAHRAAAQAERTAQPFETWRDEQLTQAAVAWILACVFVRFIEDNEMIETPLLSGPGERLQRAKDQRTLYFQRHPTQSDREYLEHVFRTVAALPAAGALFDERHNPLWAIGLSGDGATLLIEEFCQRIDPATGLLAHDFTDSELNTRFLGDLYQDLSEAARKKYALLQTPEFVEEFILDRTLTPAIAEFGLAEVKLIDPACGSGHFLLGAFHRLLDAWQQREPAVNVRELAQRALSAVHGVDLNPFAVAIARFRLLTAALKVSNVRRLADAPEFTMNLATGDSLLHGPKPGGERQMYLDSGADPLRHVYDTEDAEDLKRILGTRYQVVVGNPPYITVKDKALNTAYRERFESCHMKYSLAVPFMERFFGLAVEPPNGGAEPVGYVGTITANSFMKREFGKKLIERFIPKWDLTYVIDTSGAYIPGHGTPTVILFGRHRQPVEATIRAVLGIRGEPMTPEDPAHGLVWSAIREQIDKPGSRSTFVSVNNAQRSAFHIHPWSIGGGGAAELKHLLESVVARSLSDVAQVVGVFGMTNADDVMIAPEHSFLRRGVERSSVSRLVVGDEIRDWAIATGDLVAFPYCDERLVGIDDLPGLRRWLWPARTTLGNRATFAKLTYFAEGRPWWEWHQVCLERLRSSLSIVFAFVATHNHFVLDRGGKVFNRSAPVIKLPPDTTEEDHLALLGLLNSSTGCFWMKQVFHCKGAQGINEGGKSEKWEQFFEFDGTKLSRFPVADLALAPKDSLRLVLELADAQQRTSPSHVLREVGPKGLPTARDSWRDTLAQMIARQEEFDWSCYSSYGLTADGLSFEGNPPPVRLGERAFEIAMARKMASGDLRTTWFERHGSTPMTEPPEWWPAEYRSLVGERIALIESDPNIALIEQPEYKRRWNLEPWDSQQTRALHNWLLDRLELQELWAGKALTSIAKLTDCIRRDSEFMEAAELLKGRADFDVTSLVQDLIESDSVPFLPVLRYRDSGLRKRAAWERTWDLQRREDSGETVGEIPAPPKYTSADFLTPVYWRLRGKLDVPKERFISYPYAEREADQTLVVGWAGWDHLQQAKALAEYYVRMKEQEGWPPERLQPLLAGLLELLPWLRQWHNDLDPQFGMGMGDYFAGFVDEEIRSIGVMPEQLRCWKPKGQQNEDRPPRRSRR